MRFGSGPMRPDGMRFDFSHTGWKVLLSGLRIPAGRSRRVLTALLLMTIHGQRIVIGNHHTLDDNTNRTKESENPVPPLTRHVILIFERSKTIENYYNIIKLQFQLIK